MIYTEPVKTDMHCSHCRKPFVAQLDMSVDGNHVVECPWCGHEHCRRVEAGRVTDDRWSSRLQRVDVDARCVWKSTTEPIVTSTAAAFLRERWLNRVDVTL